MAAIPPSHSVGTLNIETILLKASLRAEAAAWKAQFAKNLHKKGLDDLQVHLLYCLSHSATGLGLEHQSIPGRLIIWRRSIFCTELLIICLYHALPALASSHCQHQELCRHSNFTSRMSTAS